MTYATFCCVILRCEKINILSFLFFNNLIFFSRPMRFGKRNRLPFKENEPSLLELKVKSIFDKIKTGYYRLKRSQKEHMNTVPEANRFQVFALRDTNNLSDKFEQNFKSLPETYIFENIKSPRPFSKTSSFTLKEDSTCDNQNPFLASFSARCRKNSQNKRNLSFLTSKELNSKQLISGIKHIMNTESLPLDPIIYGCYVSLH